MALLSSHLDDAALAQVWTDRTLGSTASSQPAEAHLQGCADCRSRYASLVEWLEVIRTDACAEADEVFGPERLGAQQTQILRRLEALEHPARVIAFPRFTQPIASHRSSARRWVAVAAAAGLMVGVGLGQVLEFGAMRSGGENAPAQIVATTRPGADAPLRAVPPAALAGDETFFDEPATTLQPRVPESLQYLNAVTPTSRDLEPQ